jgi:hypothetical protein
MAARSGRERVPSSLRSCSLLLKLMLMSRDRFYAVARNARVLVPTLE